MQSSGSGSDCGSGSRTRKASHHHAVANGDDNSNGNTDNENTSSEMNLRGGSDNGSGTQVSRCASIQNIFFILLVHRKLQMFTKKVLSMATFLASGFMDETSC
jgi:hypothetical protein